MPGPFDYSVQQPNITGSLMSGIELGQTVAAQRAAQGQAEQYKADLQDYLQSPSPQKAADMSVKYPKQREAYKQSWDILSKDQQDQTFSAGTEAYSAIQNGKPAVAIGIVDKQIKAMENSGQDASSLIKIRDSIAQDPQGAGASIALGLSSLEPERWGKIAGEMRTSQTAPAMAKKAQAEATKAQAEAGGAAEKVGLENTKSRAEVQNIQSQIRDRSSRLNLDQDKLQSDVEFRLNELGQKASTLDESAKKLINDSAIASVAADQTAGQFLDLASQLDKQGGGYGAFTSANEFLKSATGNQDAMSAARREYIRLRNTQAIKNLPPGAASDADVAMALEGFPEPSADAKTLASFLRGTAKLSQIESINESAKAEWTNAVGHLGKPKKDIEIDGVSIPAGSSFTDFAKKYIPEKTSQRGAQQAQQQVPQRSYMKYAQPAGGQ